jgi:hypothetical protein
MKTRANIITGPTAAILCSLTTSDSHKAVGAGASAPLKQKRMAGEGAKGNLDWAALIAPCGMNCRLCQAYSRARNPCPGCRGDNRGKPKTRVACRIKNCEKRIAGSADYCGKCSSFPCESLRRLDKRYRAKYGMSMIGNLKTILLSGLQSFVKSEQTRWACRRCGAVLCVHQEHCLACRRKWR